ncbi:hypothetical protein D9M69_703300 [compost metagenome]
MPASEMPSTSTYSEGTTSTSPMVKRIIEATSISIPDEVAKPISPRRNSRQPSDSARSAPMRSMTKRAGVLAISTVAALVETSSAKSVTPSSKPVLRYCDKVTDH